MVAINKKLANIKVKKLEAFTLFESVVAISIITTLIGLGTMIYSNLMQAEKPVAYYQAKDEVDRRFQELCESQAFFNKEFDYESYQIQQQVDFHMKNKKIYQVTYVVTAGNRELLTERHLVANEEND